MKIKCFSFSKMLREELGTLYLLNKCQLTVEKIIRLIETLRISYKYFMIELLCISIIEILY